jgi:L-threonylcarbamoyladenylate synthase
LRSRFLSVDEVEAAAMIVKGGGIVAVPTDTVYGLACDPSSSEAVERLFEVKGREAKPVPVLCADAGAAERLVVFGSIASALARKHWPGALTIVAPMKEGALRVVAPSLHQDTGWLGVRVPGNRFATSLARNAGGYVTGTSANISGRPSCRSAQEVADAVGERIDAVVDGGYLGGRESTVVKVVGETVEVLRRGSIAIEQGRTRQERQQRQ